MNLIRTVSIAVLLASAIPYAAHASIINFSGVDADLGTVAVGQSGSVANNLGTGSSFFVFSYGSGSDYGFLPPDSEITLTYNLTGMEAGGLTGYGSYNYSLNNNIYNGSDTVNTTGGSSTPVGTTNGAVSVPLVLASANLNQLDTTGTVNIVNLSSNLAQFQSALSGVFLSGRVVSVNYEVSAVPLPASLPMFAVAILGLLGIAVSRKRGFI